VHVQRRHANILRWAALRFLKPAALGLSRIRNLAPNTYIQRAFGVILPSFMSWSLEFDEPIELSLRDAGEYVTAPSKVDQAKQHWQTAAHELMMAAERGGILMPAEIAMRQALAHGRRRRRDLP
jgi:hypothetical protein